MPSAARGWAPCHAVRGGRRPVTRRLPAGPPDLLACTRHGGAAGPRLLHGQAHDGVAAALAAALYNLLIRQHGAERGAPVDWHLCLVRQPAAEELQEDPLRPAVVARVGRAHLAVPVVGEACGKRKNLSAGVLPDRRLPFGCEGWDDRRSRGRSVKVESGRLPYTLDAPLPKNSTVKMPDACTPVNPISHAAMLHASRRMPRLPRAPSQAPKTRNGANRPADPATYPFIGPAAPRGRTQRLQLLAEARDVALGGDARVRARLQRVLLCGQPERVPADRVQHVVALHAPQARDDVRRRVALCAPRARTPPREGVSAARPGAACSGAATPSYARARGCPPCAALALLRRGEPRQGVEAAADAGRVYVNQWRGAGRLPGQRQAPGLACSAAAPRPASRGLQTRGEHMRMGGGQGRSIPGWPTCRPAPEGYGNMSRMYALGRLMSSSASSGVRKVLFSSQYACAARVPSGARRVSSNMGNESERRKAPAARAARAGCLSAGGPVAGLTMHGSHLASPQLQDRS